MGESGSRDPGQQDLDAVLSEVLAVTPSAALLCRDVRRGAALKGLADATLQARCLLKWVKENGQQVTTKAASAQPSAFGLPPKTSAYWWIGMSPRGRQQSHYYGPGKKAPSWAAMWTCEGMPAWIRFPVEHREEVDTDEPDELMFE